MIRNFCGQVLLALLLCDHRGILGFSTIPGQCRQSTIVLAASSEISDTQTSKGTTKLELKGGVEVISSPLQRLPSDKMASFFKSIEIRNLLITAGGKRSCEELSASEEVLEEWTAACGVVGAQPPDESDRPISVKTGGIDFPGLHLVSTAKIGSKLVQEGRLRYEFVLIGDEQTVTGLPPVVWIYNKLTGSGNDGEKGSGNSSVSSLTTISYAETEDGKTIITSKASLSINVNFPSILLQILPTNKAKAEETGGKALRRTLKKDVTASMEAVEKAYKKCLDLDEAH